MISWFTTASEAGEFNHWVFTWMHRPALWEWALMALLAVVLPVFFVKNLQRLSSVRWRAILLALRLLFLLGLILLWLRPAVQLQKVLYKKSDLPVLVDGSRSMSMGEPGGRTRAEQAADFFRENDSAFKRLSKHYNLHAFFFDADARGAALDDLKAPGRADGEFTALGHALSESVRPFREGDVSGVILVSDGVENPPDAPLAGFEETVQHFKKRGIPVFAFGAGSESGVRDLSVQDVRYDGFAFVHNKTTVEARVASRGYPERKVQVNLERDGRIVAAKDIVIGANGEATASFSFTPDKVGRYVYTVSVPPSPDDAIEANNQKPFIVDVIRDKIRVLHVCGHPDYDEQFLRRHLKNNPNVDLISFFILRTVTDLQLVRENELSLIPFPTDELFDKQLHTFDLVIFQNFTYRGYQMSQYLPNIRRYVLEGGAFLVVGGDNSFQLGGYDNTPIEDILPFRLAAADPAADAAPFRMRVTEEGLRHPVLRVRPGPEANRAAWETAPELFGLNLGLTPHPEALVLAEHPNLRIGGLPAPVLAVRNVGKGRVFASAADSTWIWHMRDVEQGGDGERYRVFWNNVIRWLIRDPELKHLVVRADRDEVRPGGEMKLDIRVTDEDFQPRAGAELAVRLYKEGQPAPLLERRTTADADGGALVSLPVPDMEGMLRVDVEETGGGAEPLRDTLRLFAASGTGELAEVRTDFDRLRHLAKETGGEFFTLPHTLESLPLPERPMARVGRKRDVPIWDSWPMMAFLVLPIVLEWWFRKRKRLN